MRALTRSSGWLAAAAGRFAAVGALCAAINVSIIYLGHNLFGLHYLVPAVATCFVTIPLAYVLHSTFSFRTDRSPQVVEFVRFCSAQIGQFVVGLVLMAGLVETMNVPPALAMIGASLLLYVLSFVVNSTWVFRVLHLRRRAPPAVGEAHHVSDDGGHR